MYLQYICNIFAVDCNLDEKCIYSHSCSMDFCFRLLFVIANISSVQELTTFSPGTLLLFLLVCVCFFVYVFVRRLELAMMVGKGARSSSSSLLLKGSVVLGHRKTN